MSKWKNSSNLMFHSNSEVLQYFQIFFPFWKVFFEILEYTKTFHLNCRNIPGELNAITVSDLLNLLLLTLVEMFPRIFRKCSVNSLSHLDQMMLPLISLKETTPIWSTWTNITRPLNKAFKINDNIQPILKKRK